MRASVLIVLLATAAFAAVPPTPKFVSPEVHADRTITFRALGPKATEVTLMGGWMAATEALPMQKGADGVWSVTVGPLPPTVYAYWFVIDGSYVMDQANRYVRIRTDGTSLSMVEVPGEAPASWAMRSVPHGVIEMNTMKAETFGETRNVWVYLPPGYEKGSIRYPILYLFHGAGETHFSWTESGKANLILDNLLADSKIKPMIVVMPFTGPALGAPAPPPTPGGPPPGGQAKSAEYILKEVMPWAESRYRVAAGRKNRAIAGFSAGGALTATIGFERLDQFSQLGIFSAPTQLFSARFPNLLKDTKATNSKLDVLWMGVGKSDLGPVEGLRKMDAELTQNQIRHIYKETEGAHDFSVWRWCLTEFAPLLFRN